MNKIKKTIYTLALKGYAPELTSVTFPLMRKYAEKKRKATSETSCTN